MRILPLLVLAAALAAGEPPAVAATAAAVRPLVVGAAVPPGLRLRDLTGAEVDLAAELAAAPTVLVFFRGAWCPYCTKHLGALQQVEGELRASGWRVVAIAPDAPTRLAKAVDDGKAPRLRILADPGGAATRAFGLAFRVEDAYVAKLREHGIALDGATDAGAPFLPVPALFLVRDGALRFAHADPDFRRRLDTAALLQAARAGTAAPR